MAKIITKIIKLTPEQSEQLSSCFVNVRKDGMVIAQIRQHEFEVAVLTPEQARRVKAALHKEVKPK